LFRTDTRARAAYAEGAGIHRILPRAVARPEGASDLQNLIRWAIAERVPLVPRGAGAAWLALPWEMVWWWISPNSATHAAGRCQESHRPHRAAVTLSELTPWPPRTDSGFRSSPRADAGPHWAHGRHQWAGARSLRYGSVRRWVERLRIVTADAEAVELVRGTAPGAGAAALSRFEQHAAPALRQGAAEIIAAFPRTRKNSSGYALDAWLESEDLIDLLVGSEGTLALTTESAGDWSRSLPPECGPGGAGRPRPAGRCGQGAHRARSLGAGTADRTFLDLVRQHRGPRRCPTCSFGGCHPDRGVRAGGSRAARDAAAAASRW